MLAIIQLRAYFITRLISILGTLILATASLLVAAVYA